MLSYIAKISHKLSWEMMICVIFFLLVAVLAYMIGGYFVVGKIGDFIDENYKRYDYEIESDDKND